MDKSIAIQILNELDKGREINIVTKEIAKKNRLKKIPTKIEILQYLTNNQKQKYLELSTKPVRTLSGVAPLALMTKPIDCSHGRCTFCPGGLGSVFGDVPQSYTGNEPSTMRAIRSNYDPYLIVFNRLEQYILLNQIPEKVEVIIQGGTFPSFPEEYQEEFMKYTYKALNDFSKLFFNKDKFNFEKFKKFFELPGKKEDKERTNRIQNRLLNLKGECSLKEEIKKNETSKIRAIAVCIETKPDWCFEEHINKMLEMGTTRIELGVQTIYDNVLKHVNRGHNLKDTLKSIQLLKDSFIKIVYHIMPGLPLTTKEMDINCFEEYFKDQNFRPDGLKIYPCMVMPGTVLYHNYINGMFKPLSTKEASEIIKEGKKFIEPYCRVYRVQRDIPTKYIEAGVDKTNLRQLINSTCKCIRCREPQNKKIDFNKITLKRIDYDSSGGKEVFLSLESENNLLAFLRLRKPFRPFRKEITKDSVGIRELHTYGQASGIKGDGKIQHKGFGKSLMKEAEKIAREEFEAKKILVISGIGVKEYYKKLGYRKDGIYMSKKI